MNKSYLLSLLSVLLISSSCLVAQVRNVTYDFQKNTFDNDYDLPSEERFTINGFIDTNVQFVELEIYEGVNNKGEKKTYYTTNWLRDKADKGNQFFLSVKKPLRQNEKYDFDINLFRSMSAEEKDYTQNSIVNSISNYLLSVADNEGKNLTLDMSPEEIRDEMNSVVIDGLRKYRTRTQDAFPGFSDIIIRQLDDFEEVKGKQAKNVIEDQDNSMSQEFLNKTDALLQQVRIEVEQFFNNDLFVLEDIKTVQDHPTEKQRNVVAINGGYGGAWFNGGMNDFNYGHAPYVGLSFPLGKKSFSSKFWSNTSISTGVFILNFKDKDGAEIKGPIIQRPFYLALGYKFFRFLRFNAGAVFLEKKEDNGEFLNADKIFVRPFVGLSLELNFWADFAK